VGAQASRCDVDPAELAGALPPSPLAPALESLLASVRRGGFAELVARLRRLAVAPGDVPDLPSTSPACAKDVASCVELAAASPPSGGASYAVLRIHGDSRPANGAAALYLVYLLARGAPRMLGHVSVPAEMAWGATPGVGVRWTGNHAWLTLDLFPQCGTGCLSLPERWYDLDRRAPGPLREALSFSRGGVTAPGVPFYDRTFRGDIVDVGVDAAHPFVVVRMRACHLGPLDGDIDAYAGGPEAAEVFVREGVARFVWSATTGRFSPAPGSRLLTAEQLEGFAGGGHRLFIEESAAELSAFAARGARQRAAVRRYLETRCFGGGSADGCDRSAAAEALLRSLR
jgi:hypothetical protein